MGRERRHAVVLMALYCCSAYSSVLELKPATLSLAHSRRLLQPVREVAPTPPTAAALNLPPVAAAPQQGSLILPPPLGDMAASNETDLAPSPSFGPGGPPGNQRSKALPSPVVDADKSSSSPGATLPSTLPIMPASPLPEGGSARKATAPPSPQAGGNPPVPIPASQEKHISAGVIVVIVLGASVAALAVVASAIQLARRRRQRRALLVRDTIHKDSIKAPVLELGSGRSDSAEHTWSTDKAILPIVQMHRKSLYVPDFVTRHLLKGSSQLSGGKSHSSNDSQSLIHSSSHNPSVEMQIVHGKADGVDDMEVDLPHSSGKRGSEPEEWQDLDISDMMDYESSEPTTSSDSWGRKESRGSNGDSAHTGAPRGTLRSQYSNQMLPLNSNNRWDSAGSAELPSPGGSGRASISGTAALQDWEIDPSDIEILRREDGTEWLLGEGAFGKVYKAIRGGTTEVAVKIVTAGTHVELTEFQNEAAVLAGCRDSHIVQFFGASFHPVTMLVTEYMPGGNLRARLSSYEDSELFLWRKRGRKLVLDVAAGLVFLHSRRIVHFDLKAANVLLSEDGCSAKIADVGMASVLSNAEYVTSVGNSGTFAWAAPELLMGKKCSPKADMYSFGVLLFEVATGEMPRRGCLRDIRIPEEGCKGLEMLLNSCLEADPKKRPSARQAYDILKLLPVS